MRKWLWALVITGLLAAVPLAFERVQTERSSKVVEIVFDYRDLVETSQFRANPESFVLNHLSKLKEAGVGSLAVYESTLEELEQSGRVKLYKESEYFMLTGSPAPPNQNFTYLLFRDREVRGKIQPLIEDTFRDRLKVNLHPWNFRDEEGLVIELPYEEAVLKPMAPDPITLDLLQQQNFQIVVRLSNRIQPFNQASMDLMFQGLQKHGVKRIVFDGNAVTGHDDNPKRSNIATMAALMNKYQIGSAAIELLKQPQAGFNKLAYQTSYNVVRLHSLTEKDASLPTDRISDRLLLAVKDRNIRMVFLNIKAARDMEKGYINDSLDNLYTSLQGPQGAVERIQKAGFTIGTAEPFDYIHNPAFRFLKMLLLFGGAAIAALTAGYFVRALMPPVFILILAAIGVLYFKAPSLALQAMALAAGSFAPTLAVILAVQALRQYKSSAGDTAVIRMKRALFAFARALAISFIGVIYVIGLLNNITYFLVLDQFRGVSLLHLVPILLAAVYLVFFNEAASAKEVVSRMFRLMRTNVSILWVLLAAIAGAGVWYYLSRTGNEGQASTYERMFRALLEETMGVRPRTKEFLFAHPLFLLGAYLSFKYRNALYFMIIGVIGQLSVVDTFAHLHTPLYISFIRAAYGVILGSIVGLSYIAVWEIFARGWNKWAPMLKE